ncbi:hypothetical protein INR49_007567 [Caranx melampygus]|nr:hypothetical protein INR49_007567 [Caranx melampygus]
MDFPEPLQRDREITIFGSRLQAQDLDRARGGITRLISGINAADVPRGKGICRSSVFMLSEEL